MQYALSGTYLYVTCYTLAFHPICWNVWYSLWVARISMLISCLIRGGWYKYSAVQVQVLVHTPRKYDQIRSDKIRSDQIRSDQIIAHFLPSASMMLGNPQTLDLGPEYRDPNLGSWPAGTLDPGPRSGDVPAAPAVHGAVSRMLYVTRHVGYAMTEEMWGTSISLCAVDGSVLQMNWVCVMHVTRC